MDTKGPAHGDFATNWAMVAVKSVAAGGEGAFRNPRELAEALAAELRADDRVASVEVAGPGFVNVRLTDGALASGVEEAGSLGAEGIRDWNRGRLPESEQRRINVEFVSVNPNGPITIGSGRGAAYGSTLCNVLAAAGHEVHREYYINDGVNSEQMRLFGESVYYYALQQAVQAGFDNPDPGFRFPEGGYKGDYVQEVAAWIVECSAGQDATEGPEYFVERAKDFMIDIQKEALDAFGVSFDTWFSEESLHVSGVVARCIESLEEKGVADRRPVRTKLKLGKGGKVEEVVFEDQAGAVEEDEPGSPPPTPSSFSPGTNHPGNNEEGAPETQSTQTLWLRSTLFGDDMDRVLQRADGRLTYIASDVAYHADKFNRPENADLLITVLGPDHHGYIERLHAVVAAHLIAEGGLRKAEGAGASESEPNTTSQQSAIQGAPGLADWEAQLYGTLEWRDACRAARALSEGRLKVQIFQLVRFLKDGKPAPMRKRDGNIYALIDLVREIGQKVKPGAPEEEQLKAGKDVARFFYLMRHHDTTFDFDLDLAERQSDENPVFYVQYAHARICSVIAKAEEAGFTAAAPQSTPSESTSTSHLGKNEGVAPELHPKERALVLKALDLPYEVLRCAEDYGVNRLATYAIELARTYHHFYDACRVVDQADPETSRRRLGYCKVAQASLRAVLDLLGVSAPDRMDREAPTG